MDRMDGVENDKLQLLFAECVYASGVSFHAVTTKRWKEFFARIRPNFELPTRQQLGGGLLEKSYQKNVKTVDVYLEKTDYISLVIDGWTNIRKDAIINIVAMTPAPLFVKSIDTKGETKDADYMFSLLDQIIKKLGPKKITGLISDNEQKMLSLKDKVTKEYKHIVFSGCVAHKLNCLIKKICELKPIENIISGAKDIVKEINGNQKLHAKYRQMMVADRTSSLRELKLFSETRFAGSIMMMKSVIDSVTALRSLAGDRNNKMSEINRKRILSLDEHLNFFQNLVHLQSTLKPICDGIHEIERNCCSIADMIEQIKTLEKIPLDGIKSFGDDIVSKVTKLFNDTMLSAKTPSALLANVLHPLYRGKNLSVEEKSTASLFIGIFSRNLDTNFNLAMKSYRQFINGEGYFSHQFLSAMEPESPISWWKFVSNMSDNNLLCEIAMRLLNIQPTNTAVERSFSKQKRIHSKDRNRLQGDKVNKLMYISSNINTFDFDISFDERLYFLESDCGSDCESDEGSVIDLSDDYTDEDA